MWDVIHKCDPGIMGFSKGTITEEVHATYATEKEAEEHRPRGHGCHWYIVRRHAQALPCDQCEGTGKLYTRSKVERMCPACNGSGKAQTLKERHYDVSDCQDEFEDLGDPPGPAWSDDY